MTTIEDTNDEDEDEDKDKDTDEEQSQTPLREVAEAEAKSGLLAESLEAFFVDALGEEQMGTTVSPNPAPTWGSKLGHFLFDEKVTLTWPNGTPTPDEVEDIGYFRLPYGVSFVNGAATVVKHALIPRKRIEGGLDLRSIGFARRRCVEEKVPKSPEPCPGPASDSEANPDGGSGFSEGDACPICLDCFLPDQDAWRLPCFHRVHESCALLYFGMRRMTPLCPLCRCDLREDEAWAWEEPSIAAPEVDLTETSPTFES